MYTLIRKIHLYAALIISVFLLLYFFSGAVIIMGETFPTRSEKVLSRQEPVSPNEPDTSIIARICEQYAIHGQLRKQVYDQIRVYNFLRPGYRAEVTVNNHKQIVSTSIWEGNYGRVMSDFHRLTGYQGGARTLLALFYDLTCIALLVFALTGLYLWLKIEKSKAFGIILLLISTTITVGTVWYLMVIG